MKKTIVMSLILTTFMIMSPLKLNGADNQIKYCDDDIKAGMEYSPDLELKKVVIDNCEVKESNIFYY